MDQLQPSTNADKLSEIVWASEMKASRQRRPTIWKSSSTAARRNVSVAFCNALSKRDQSALEPEFIIYLKTKQLSGCLDIMTSGKTSCLLCVMDYRSTRAFTPNGR